MTSLISTLERQKQFISEFGFSSKFPKSGKVSGFNSFGNNFSCNITGDTIHSLYSNPTCVSLAEKDEEIVIEEFDD